MMRYLQLRVEVVSLGQQAVVFGPSLLQLRRQHLLLLAQQIHLLGLHRLDLHTSPSSLFIIIRTDAKMTQTAEQKSATIRESAWSHGQDKYVNGTEKQTADVTDGDSRRKTLVKSSKEVDHDKRMMISDDF